MILICSESGALLYCNLPIILLAQVIKIEKEDDIHGKLSMLSRGGRDTHVDLNSV